VGAGLALVYFLLAGMIVYFRWVPFARVLDRMRREGTELPAAYAWIATLGVSAVAALLVWRGIRILRRPPS
jgi:hypothetical protein